MKLRGAVQENDSITQEIASMKMTLMKLQTERLKAGGKAAHEVDAALAKVRPQTHYALACTMGNVLLSACCRISNVAGSSHAWLLLPVSPSAYCSSQPFTIIFQHTCTGHMHRQLCSHINHLQACIAVQHSIWSSFVYSS